jgi:hypothetical protein
MIMRADQIKTCVMTKLSFLERRKALRVDDVMCLIACIIGKAIKITLVEFS